MPATTSLLVHALLSDFTRWDEWKRTNGDRCDLETARMLPLVHRRLTERGRRDDPWYDRAVAAYRQTWLRTQFLFAAMRKSIARLRQESIAVMLLKGAALTDRYYGDRGLRPMLDFDLLVHEADFARAAALFQGMGWTAGRDGHPHLLTVRYDLQFFTRGAECDLHWTPYPGASAAFLESLWRDSVASTFEGSDVRLPSPSHLVAHVLIHGGGDTRSLIDAGMVLGREPELTFEDILRSAEPEKRSVVGGALNRLARATGRSELAGYAEGSHPMITRRGPARVRELGWLLRRGGVAGIADFFGMVRRDWELRSSWQIPFAAVGRVFLPAEDRNDRGVVRALFPAGGVASRSIVVSAPAAYAEGGLGQALATLVEESRSSGKSLHYFSFRAKAADGAGEAVVVTPVPLLTHGLSDYQRGARFDRAVARRLQRADSIISFSGAASRTFQRARHLGYDELLLEPGTSHVRNVQRQHQKALTAWPIESDWLTPLHVRRQLREYELADRIFVTSEYSRRSFLAEGVDEGKLVRREQPAASRFAPPATVRHRGRFTVVYVGRLHVTKGVPLLIEAFSRLHDRDAELHLFGGWATKAMERYLRRCQAADPRIRIGNGDPLLSYHAADVLVHPSFEDSLALAPLEALACGVPVIVSDHTGMAERVRDGVNGFVTLTGDGDAVLERLEWIREHPLKSSQSLS